MDRSDGISKFIYVHFFIISDKCKINYMITKMYLLIFLKCLFFIKIGIVTNLYWKKVYINTKAILFKINVMLYSIWIFEMYILILNIYTYRNYLSMYKEFYTLLSNEKK